MRCPLSCAVLLVAAGLHAFAQSSPAPIFDPERPHYLFFSRLERGPAEVKINDAAQHGYRLLTLQKGMNGGFVVVMEDLVASGSARYEYKLLAGHWEHYFHDEGRMIRLLNDAAASGFCVSRSSLDSAGSLNDEALPVEREIGSSDRCEYRESGAVRLEMARKDTRIAMHDGFEPILLRTYNGRVLLFQKRTNSQAHFDSGTARSNSKSAQFWNALTAHSILAPSDAVVDIVGLNAKHLPRRLQEELDRGMHVLLMGSGYPDVQAILAPMPSAPPDRLIYADIKAREVTLVWGSNPDWSRAEAALNAAAEGYTMGTTPIFVRAAGRHPSVYFLAILESTLAGHKLQYKIVQRRSLPDLAQTVNEAAQQGWWIRPDLVFSEELVILQREVRP